MTHPAVRSCHLTLVGAYGDLQPSQGKGARDERECALLSISLLNKLESDLIENIAVGRIEAVQGTCFRAIRLHVSRLAPSMPKPKSAHDLF
jgi:hypothetical protein